MDSKIKYIKTADNNKEREYWVGREKRELFCKATNTLFMSQDPKTQLKPLDDLLEIAKRIVDRAFENYPDKTNEEEEVELPL